MIYFDRIEVVNMLVPTAGNTLRPPTSQNSTPLDGTGKLHDAVDNVPTHSNLVFCSLSG